MSAVSTFGSFMSVGYVKKRCKDVIDETPVLINVSMVPSTGRGLPL